jgi:RNA polymerase sigma factor (sigma-70 family)
MGPTLVLGFLQRLKRDMSAEALAALSDRELVERFLSTRDEEAFGAILLRHGPMVYRVCRRVLPGEQDAEDAFQAAFLVLVRSARTIRRQASLASWLHGVAYRIALKARAVAARRRAALTLPEQPRQPGLVDELSWKELRSLLDEELARLPEKFRAVLVLCYLQGLTQDEAAHQLGWSKITCRRYLERGRELLGTRLARRGVTLSAVLFAPLLCECSAIAALPPNLLGTTQTAAVALAGGNAVTAAVPQGAMALADEFRRGAALARWKWFFLALAILGVGLGGAAASRWFRSEYLLSPEQTGKKDTQTETRDLDAGRILDLADSTRLECRFPTLTLEHEIQTELRLTPDQVRRIEEVLREVRGEFQEEINVLIKAQRERAEFELSLQGQPEGDEEVRARAAVAAELKRLRRADADLRTRIEAVRTERLRQLLPILLQPPQARRYRQLELQVMGLGAFSDPDVERVLCLTPDQKTGIRAIAREDSKLLPRPNGSVAIPSDFRPSRKVPRVLQLLDEDQRKVWATLTGAPAKLDLKNGSLLVEVIRASVPPPADQDEGRGGKVDASGSTPRP